MSGAITVWVITWRFAWILVLTAAGLLVAAGLSRVPALARRLPPVRAVAAPLLTPITLVLWAGMHWATKPPRNGVSTVHNILLAISLSVAMIWPFLFRKASGVGFIVAAGVVGFLFSVAVWFVGTMAITDAWL